MSYKVTTEDGKELKYKGQSIWAADISGAVKSVDREKRLLKITGTTEEQDRDGDIMEINGWELDNFLKNPVMLYAHDYRGIPVAGAVNIVKRRNPKRLEFWEKFPPEGLYAFADLILDLYDLKILNASSVGFIPYKWDPMDGEKEDVPPHQRYGRRYKQQELLELSACPVPANPGALQSMLSLEGKSYAGGLGKWAQGEEAQLEFRAAEKAEEVVESLGVKVIEIEEEGEVIVQVPDNVVDSEKETKEVPASVSEEEEIEREAEVEEEKVEEEEKTEDVEQEFATVRNKELWDEVGGGKKIGAPRNLPLADIDHSWDRTAAEKRVRKWASSDGSGDKDKIKWSKYKKAFCWYDPDNQEAIGGYKMPIADIAVGELKVVWKGVAAAMGVLNGAMGGVDVPDDDRKAIHALLKVYYKKFDKEPPELRSFSDLAAETKELTEEFETLKKEVASSQVQTDVEEADEKSSVFEVILSPKGNGDKKAVPSTQEKELRELTEQVRRLTEKIKTITQ